MRINIELNDAQMKFWEAKEKVVALICGRGLGKTTVAMLKACSEPRGRILILSATYRLLEDVCVHQLNVFNDECRGKLVRNYCKTSATATLCSGTQLLFRSADRPDRLRGLTVSGLYVEEAATVQEAAFRTALGCVREKGNRYIRLVSTPNGTSSWLYKYIKSAGVREVKAPSRANPFLTEDYFEAIRDAYPTALQAQELEGEWVDIGAVVKAHWLRFVSDSPQESLLRCANSSIRVVSVDGAVGAGEECDFSAIAALMREPDGTTHVPELYCGRPGYAELKKKILDMSAKYAAVILIENTSVGSVLLREMQEQGVFCIPATPKGDKTARAGRLLAQLERGKVSFHESFRDSEGFNQLLAFGSRKAHDDAVDALSQGVNYIWEQTNR